jgi:protein tyrosine phosphatase
MFFRSVKQPVNTESTEPSLSFVERVIKIAKKDYVHGSVYALQHSRVTDASFIRNTNHILGTHFIASTGPRDKADTINFINDTAFHDPQINYIVAIGDKLSELDACPIKADFLNYFIGNNKQILGHYSVSRQQLNGGKRHVLSEHETSPDVFIESKLSISYKSIVKEMSVIGIELKDGRSIKLKHDTDDVIKEILWKIFIISLDNPVLIHCKHGHGRTGHLILTLEILKHYSTLFASDDPEVVAKNILNLLTDVRSQRPGLVRAPRQFIEAIRNAYLLHRYGLDKGYDVSFAADTHPCSKNVLALR